VKKRFGERRKLWGLSVLFIAAIVVPVTLAGLGNTTSSATTAPPAERAATATAAPPVSSYSELVRAMNAGDVRTVTLDAGTGNADVTYEDGTAARVVLPIEDGTLVRQLAESGATVTVEGERGGGGEGSFLHLLLPPLLIFALVLGFFWLMRRRAKAGGGGGMLGMPDTSLRKSVELAAVPPERFADVAGVDEAVEELAELVDFFHEPARFHLLGAKMPSGVMLHGSPGTGKTLLAKALAGEAGVPFYAVSGSDFVEKFVGVGASRVRELFARARANERGAVIFIDEIDAVGRARSSGEGNGEREQTLNQILVELDGFSTTDRVICIAATNRLDVLDPALLRPGRFGRHIAVPLPSADGRESILRVHASGKPLAGDVELAELAASMGGMSGAQLAEVVNEAAIMAARDSRFEIDRSHFREAYLRVLAGPKRRSAPIASGELEVIAAHEAGHVLTAEAGERYEKAQQVTIEPRGQAMGLAVYGQVDRALHDPDYLHEALVATLGGRAAEQIAFSRVSSGAANDLQKATELARQAVEELGFSPHLGQIVAGRSPFADSTKAVVDREIERMVADAYADALAILDEHREQLDRLRARLLEQRELERVDILAAIGSMAPPRAALRPLPRSVPALAPQGLPLAATTGGSAGSMRPPQP
jgi:cell division protease FtsH